MSKIILNNKFILSLINLAILITILIVYNYFVCKLSNLNLDLELIYFYGWRQSTILVASYTVAKITVLSTRVKINIVNSFLLTFIIYVFIYGLLSFAYMIVSFLQPLNRNVSLHILIFVLASEIIGSFFIRILPTTSK